MSDRPRAKADYATHLPILIGLGRVLKIERVLELGTGRYSTPTFLDRSIFPSLVKLTSVENSPDWGPTILDERLDVNLVIGKMASFVGGMGLESYDLIFVDDSETMEDRTATIRAISDRRPRRPIVVIHDFEIEAYQQAAKFLHRFIFTAFTPQTGVVWNGVQTLLIGLLDSVALVVGRTELEPDDVVGWKEAFS